MMYDVDTKGIEKRLHFIEELATLIPQLVKETDSLHILAVERIVHVTIESITDVGNALIDGFIMRDPGSYSDIIDILCDQSVLSSPLAEQMKPLVMMRKELVQQYYELGQEKVYEMAHVAEQIIPAFCEQVRGYLARELF